MARPKSGGDPGDATSGAAAGPGPGAQPGGTRFQMRQRLFAFGDDFDIENDQGERVFHVDGQALRLRATLLFQDMQGHDIYRIQEKLLRVRDSMRILRGKVVVARVHNALFTPLRDRFRIEIPGGQDMVTRGNILYHEYTIERNGDIVAKVSKSWFHIRDTYGVEVAQSEDAPLLLAITVVIDTMSHEGR
ncbi:MAG TPA: LURP-one-related family protein [Roseiflexaceae bacterium]|nr:LURP-one-related family protein [Roseiflexaceae bacterium]